MSLFQVKIDCMKNVSHYTDPKLNPPCHMIPDKNQRAILFHDSTKSDIWIGMFLRYSLSGAEHHYMLLRCFYGVKHQNLQ